MNVMLLDDVGKNGKNKIEKTEDSNKTITEEEDREECLVCFESIGDKKYVACKLCDRKCHKDCYYKFVQKNPFFNRKCFQCQTKTIKFKNKKRYNLCCFC